MPRVVHDTHVTVTNARVRQVYQNLADAGLGGFDFLDLGRDAARVVIHDSFVTRRYLNGSHDSCSGGTREEG